MWSSDWLIDLGLLDERVLNMREDWGEVGKREDNELLERMTDQLGQFMEERRFEDALTLLYAFRDRTPEDRSVPRAIQILKKKLLGNYKRTVGSLNAVPSMLRAANEIGPAERQVSELVDGQTSFEEILEISPFGRFGTYRALASLVADELVRSRRPSCGFDVVMPSNLPEPMPDEEVTTSEISTGDIRESAYEVLIGDATEALLRRDYGEAQRLFEECHRLDPSDRLVRYNLDRLSQMTRARDC